MLSTREMRIMGNFDIDQSVADLDNSILVADFPAGGMFARAWEIAAIVPFSPAPAYLIGFWSMERS
jgi:hypothetical protein